MTQAEVHMQWENAAPGWAKWEMTMAGWMHPATEAMLDMAGVVPGAHVLDLACGAGSQTVSAARRVGPRGHVLAADISSTMLQHLLRSVRAAQLENVSAFTAAAEELGIRPERLDAAICRLGLMLFPEPARALATVRQALKPGGRMAVIVFSVPAANAFMAKPLQILHRHAGREPPAPGQPGIFALGFSGVLERLLRAAQFANYRERRLAAPLRMSSATQALMMMQEAFGAYRAVISGCPEAVRTAAWGEVAEVLRGFETARGFEAPAEVVVAVADSTMPDSSLA